MAASGAIGRRAPSPRAGAALLAVALCVVSAFISIHLIHDSYGSNAFDLGLFAQSLKSTLEGRLLYHTIGGLSHLAYHFSPVLLLLVPVYALFPHCETLLIVQSLAMGASAYLVFDLARAHGLSDSRSLFLELLFAVNPMVWGVLLFDFHPVVFCVPALLLAFLGAARTSRWLFWTGICLALITKEDVIMAVGVFGFVTLAVTYPRRRQFDRTAFWVWMIAMLAFSIAVIVSMLTSEGDSPRILSYAYVRFRLLQPTGLADIPGAVLALAVWLLSSQAVYLAFLYLAPFGFVPLLGLDTSAPALLIWAMNALSVCPAQNHLLRQSAVAALPFLIESVIVVLASARQHADLDRLFRRYWRWLVVWTLVVSVVLVFSPSGRANAAKLPGPHEAAIDRVLAQIPDGATVTANNTIFPHVCTRTTAYIGEFWDPFTPVEAHAEWGFPDRDTDYVVIDRVYVQNGLGGTWEDAARAALPGRYVLVYEDDGVELYWLGEAAGAPG